MPAPNMKAVGLSSDHIMNILADMEGATKKLGADITTFTSQQQEAFGQVAASQTAIGDVNARIDSTEEAAKIKRQESLQLRAKQLGVGADSEELSILNDQLVMTQADARNTAEQYSKLSSISAGDDLFGWLTAQIKMPFVKEELDAKNIAQKNIADQIQTRQVLTQQNAATQKAIDLGTYAGKELDLAEKARKSADILAQQALANKAAAGLTGVQLTSANNMAQVKIAQDAYEVSVKNAHLALAINSDARAAASLAMERERFNWQKELKAEEKAKSDRFYEKLNIANKLLIPGAPDLTKIDLEKMSKKQSDIMVDMANNVSITERPDGTKAYSFQSTPTALQAMYTERGISPPATMRELFTRVAEVETKFVTDYNQKNLTTGGWKTLQKENPAAARALLDNAVETKIKGDMALVSPGDGANIYNLGSFGSLVMATPILQADPIAKKMATYVADARYSPRPEDILTNAEQIYGVGSAGSKIAAFYRNMQTATYQGKGLAKAGVPALGKMIVPMELPDGTRMNIDAFSGIAWDNFSLRAQFARDNMKEAAKGDPALNPMSNRTQLFPARK